MGKEGKNKPPAMLNHNGPGRHEKKTEKEEKGGGNRLVGKLMGGREKKKSLHNLRRS